MHQLWIGIDPGKSGGMASVSTANTITLWKWEDVYLASNELYLILPAVGDLDGIAIAYLEKVHAMPKQGVTSMFSFGRNVGQWEGILAAHGVPVEYVAPGTWQKALGCLTKGDKNVTLLRARQMYPHYASEIKHWGADALLIAEYARRVTCGS